MGKQRKAPVKKDPSTSPAKKRKSPAKVDPSTSTAKKRKSPAMADPSTEPAKKRKSSPAKKDSTTDTDAPTVKGRRQPKRRVFSKAVLTVDVDPNTPVYDHDGEADGSTRFIGEPVEAGEAQTLWPDRYRQNDKGILRAKAHFRRAEVDGQVYNLGDNAQVQGEKGKEDFICKIVELFEDVNGEHKFSAQWFYRADDTIIQQKCGDLLVDKRNIFFSKIKDDNALGCLVKKLDIVLLPLNAEDQVKANLVSKCDFYYDKMYLLPYTSFVNVQSESAATSSESASTISCEADTDSITHSISEVEVEGQGVERTLLDLYSGCGGMSTGLCLGANSNGVKLVTKWAVDFNKYACESLRLNHPETQARHEKAEDFLTLIKEWEKLISFYISQENQASSSDTMDVEEDEVEDDGQTDPDVYEVESILGICYGDPLNIGSSQLYFKIRWKGYDDPKHDTWEPKHGVSAPEKLKEFVLMGYKNQILPLPGTVDVICGGPPCQGISGYNRFRNKDAPLEDPKNQQLTVFMDIVSYLKPKFVLMENVVDLFKFADGFLGRYAMGSLVKMGYQARMGMMAAGAYGLPQFRMRAFVWGALPTEKLPQYPLPTHNVVVRGVTPLEFEPNTVAYEEGSQVVLKNELFLKDAISDLPAVENHEVRDQMQYRADAQNEFQRFIRLRKDAMPGYLNVNAEEVVQHDLYDHRPLCLNNDDYERVCLIPQEKGANFRNLDGVRVRPDNKVEWDPTKPRVYLSSGKPLVPDYAMSFVKGTSTKPFGRLWWDETVSTVVTRAEPHNQAILHPNQHRVLTIRENARLQGYPDYYKLVGPVKERYIQVGNAVAVPVARALGYSLALALRGLATEEPVFTLPEEYPAMEQPAIDMI